MPNMNIRKENRIVVLLSGEVSNTKVVSLGQFEFNIPKLGELDGLVVFEAITLCKMRNVFPGMVPMDSKYTRVATCTYKYESITLHKKRILQSQINSLIYDKKKPICSPRQEEWQ